MLVFLCKIIVKSRQLADLQSYVPSPFILEPLGPGACAYVFVGCATLRSRALRIDARALYRRQSVWRRKVFIYLFYFDFIRFYFILFHFILILYSFYGAYMHVAYMQPCDSGTCARAQVRETQEISLSLNGLSVKVLSKFNQPTLNTPLFKDMYLDSHSSPNYTMYLFF